MFQDLTLFETKNSHHNLVFVFAEELVHFALIASGSYIFARFARKICKKEALKDLYFRQYLRILLKFRILFAFQWNLVQRIWEILKYSLDAYQPTDNKYGENRTAPASHPVTNGTAACNKDHAIWGKEIIVECMAID